MSQDEVVERYLQGKLSRRMFIRKLVATGVSVAAAVSYAEQLSPAAPIGVRLAGFAVDEHDFRDEHAGADEHAGPDEHGVQARV